MKFIKEIQNLPPFTFDDIVLLPQYSEVDSRLDSRLNTDSKLFDYTFKTPIVSANMDCVTGPAMAEAMNNLGGLGIVHRFFKTPEDRKQAITSLYNFPYGVSVGIADSEIDFIVANSHMIPFVCVDVAHAHNKKCLEFVKRLMKESAKPIIVGNVSTYDGAKALSDLGVECVKVGIGGGCFAVGTMVNTSRGMERIENVSIGDKVLTHTGVYHEVVGRMTRKTEEVYIINNIECTPNHEFYVIDAKFKDIVTEENVHTRAQWKRADELTNNDLLISR